MDLLKLLPKDLVQNMKDKSKNADLFFLRINRFLEFPNFSEQEIQEIKKEFKR